MNAPVSGEFNISPAAPGHNSSKTVPLHVYRPNPRTWTTTICVGRTESNAGIVLHEQAPRLAYSVPRVDAGRSHNAATV